MACMTIESFVDSAGRIRSVVVPVDVAAEGTHGEQRRLRGPHHLQARRDLRSVQSLFGHHGNIGTAMGDHHRSRPLVTATLFTMLPRKASAYSTTNASRCSSAGVFHTASPTLAIPQLH